jgi:DNA-directed RNA polymerase subunit RPC12/RpoP
MGQNAEQKCPRCESEWCYYKKKPVPVVREKVIITWRMAKHYFCGQCGNEWENDDNVR